MLTMEVLPRFRNNCYEEALDSFCVGLGVGIWHIKIL